MLPSIRRQKFLETPQLILQGSTEVHSQGCVQHPRATQPEAAAYYQLLPRKDQTYIINSAQVKQLRIFVQQVETHISGIWLSILSWPIVAQCKMNEGNEAYILGIHTSMLNPARVEQLTEGHHRSSWFSHPSSISIMVFPCSSGYCQGDGLWMFMVFPLFSLSFRGSCFVTFGAPTPTAKYRGSAVFFLGKPKIKTAVVQWKMKNWFLKARYKNSICCKSVSCNSRISNILYQ